MRAFQIAALVETAVRDERERGIIRSKALEDAARQALECVWARITQYSYRKACGGRVILFAGKPSDHKCVCGKPATENRA